MIHSGRGFSLAVLGVVGCISVAFTTLLPKQQIALGLGGVAFCAWCIGQGSLQEGAAERYGLFLIGATSLYLLGNRARLVWRARELPSSS